MKTAYLDCFSGISGDMFLGALINIGLPFETLKKTIQTLPFEGYILESRKDKKNELSGTNFTVRLTHEHHEHRGLKEIQSIIDRGDLNKKVKKQSIQIFKSLALVEGNIHGKSPDEIHFHEVGAIDSIIDIVGVVFALDFLGIQLIFASKIPLGSGFIECQHGSIPIPAPATIALLKGIPIFDSGLNYELVTPTGAALLKGLVDHFGEMPPMVIDNVGYGVGTRDLPDRPNLLRIISGDNYPEKQGDTIVILEANLDDSTPEWSGYLMDRLFDSGALDVVFIPVQMKKNRPGIQIQVIGKPQHKDKLMNILFTEGTSLGIRFRYSNRQILERSQIIIDSPWGKIEVKKASRPDGSHFISPEYEVCRKIAEKHAVPLKEIYYWIFTKNLP